MKPDQTVTVGTGMQIAYQRYGDEGDPPLLMVNGFGVQLTAWNPDLLQMLVDRGLQLIVFDNRDVGLSTHLDQAGAVDVMALMSGQATAPYLLSDMAADAAGLLESLGFHSAHLLGVSLGGMIAQSLAIEHPDRVRSLTSIMSTPDFGVGAATPEAGEALLSPAATTLQGAVDRSLRLAAVIGSQVYERDEEWIRQAVGLAWDRGNDPIGTGRQLAAVVLSPDRRPGLASVTVPTLVVHGEVDPLIQVDGGRATADAIAGSELLVLPGMAHDIPRALWATVVDAVVALVHRAESARPPLRNNHPDTHKHARWGRLSTPQADRGTE